MESNFTLEQFGQALKEVSDNIRKIASELDDSGNLQKQASNAGLDSSMGTSSTLPSKRGGNPLLDFILS